MRFCQQQNMSSEAVEGASEENKEEDEREERP